MLTRRDFGLAGASAGLSLITVGETNAQGVTKIRMANASGVIDSQIIFLTAGMNPKLGFYRDEKVEKDIINMSGVGQTIQAVTTGNSEVSPVSPPGLLQVWLKNKDIDLVCAYCWLRQVHWGIVVKPDSPAKTIADLKGKKIGIRNQGDTGFIGAKPMLKELGMDPDKDVEWIPIGEGGPAGDAIHKGRVDAMAYWDGGIARVELAGFPLRYLPNTPGMQSLFGNSYAVRKSELAKNKDVLARYFRAMAKSTVFAHTNPEASVRLAWEVFPETKPKGPRRGRGHEAGHARRQLEEGQVAARQLVEGQALGRPHQGGVGGAGQVRGPRRPGQGCVAVLHQRPHRRGQQIRRRRHRQDGPGVEGVTRRCVGRTEPRLCTGRGDVRRGGRAPCRTSAGRAQWPDSVRQQATALPPVPRLDLIAYEDCRGSTT